MEREHLKFVIVGHVDHGKSTLIGRLFYDTDSLPEGKMEEIMKTCEALGRDIEFAYVMDHLQEEREQGITIDTAQTFFKSPKRDYVIIDAPGHRKFIKNMITGASQADAAVLIVDAEEGVREQTRRHSYILGMLGLQQVIVALNKMDLVGFKKERFEEVKKELLAFLKEININPAHVIPISAKEGDNVAKKTDNLRWFDGPSILEALDTFRIPESPRDKPLRFPVQDVYNVGDKRVLVGRVEAGCLQVGQEVTVSPDHTTTNVKSIEVFGEDRSEAEAGESIGVTLDDPLPIERGQVICDPKQLPTETSRLHTNLFWISRRPYTSGEVLTVRLATQEQACNIKAIEKRINSSSLEVIEENAGELNETEVGEVVIETPEPLVMENFNDVQELGRIVLVRDHDTVAGGIITRRSER